MNEQEKREKVITLLERYVDAPNLAGVENYGAKIVDMPAPLIADTLALLKAQEPRVMTLEEVKSAWRNRDIAFLVEYNDGGNPVWMLYYIYLSTLEEIVLIDQIAHLHHFGVDGYGIDWRCWTSRPTDEQMEATPWQQ